VLKTYTYPHYPYVQSPEQRTGQTVRHPVVVIGAGPIGLTQALDLAQRGIPCVVLDDNDTVSVGSRAVCYAKRPLEIWDRLGVAAPLLAKGVQWKVGKVFFGTGLAYRFDLLPEAGHKLPAMINCQQYHVEEHLVQACSQAPQVELRWKHKVLAIEQDADASPSRCKPPMACSSCRRSGWWPPTVRTATPGGCSGPISAASFSKTGS